MTLSAVTARGVLGHGSVSWSLWIPFAVIVFVALLVDLGLLRRSQREPTVREALGWCALWAGLATFFGIALFALRGANTAAEFFAGYFVEVSLSVDNLFAMMLVFAQLHIGRAAQRRVLVWGILGAVVLRVLLVAAGTSLVAQFHVLTYVLGGLLIVGSVKLLREVFSGGKEHALTELQVAEAPSTSGLIGRLRGWLGKLVPIADEPEAETFFVRRGGRWLATPLVLAVITIELADAIFALDSIPAVLGVTTDPLVVITSNIFAILGLRSLFFVTSSLLDRLKYLKHGLAVVLLVVGTKMLLGAVFHPPAWATLVLVTLPLAGAVAASLLHKPAGEVDHAQES